MAWSAKLTGPVIINLTYRYWYYGGDMRLVDDGTQKLLCRSPAHSGAKCQIHAHNTRSRYLNNSDTDINYIYIPTDCGTSLFKFSTLNEIFWHSGFFWKLDIWKKQVYNWFYLCLLVICTDMNGIRQIILNSPLNSI